MFGFFFQLISITRANKMLTCQEYTQPSHSIQEIQIIQIITRRMFLWTAHQNTSVQFLALLSLYKLHNCITIDGLTVSFLYLGREHPSAPHSINRCSNFLRYSHGRASLNAYTEVNLNLMSTQICRALLGLCC